MQNKMLISVLIVDDEQSILALLEKMIGKRIQHIYTASNGEEALQCFKNNTIDMVISDLKMPLMDGIELLKQVRAIDINIPFILCTALADHDALINAIEHGISSILSKPINTKVLFEKIEKVASDKETKELAAIAMQVKDNFLANMSHEIRTPMNAILGFIPLIQNGVLDEKQKKYMNILETSAKTLLTIVNDILDFSKLESGKFELDLIPTNLSVELEKIGEIFAVKIEEKQIQYTLFIDPLIPKFIKIDSLRLQQILSNLMSNAIKFTPKNGKIELSSHFLLREANDFKIRISVKDTGIGIEDTQKNKIFSAFSQADNSISRKYGGTGLGLSISSSFVSLMESELCVESIVGQGSEFYFDIWVAMSKENEIDIDSSEYLNTSLNYDANVLLAEDNEVNQILLHEILSYYDIVPDIVANGEEAIQKMSTNQYDLVLMDINMPVMDGVTALQIAKIQNIKVPIIALTANAVAGDREKFLNYGFSDYLSKPIDSNEVQRVLFKFLNTQNSNHNVHEDHHVFFEPDNYFDPDRIKEAFPFAENIIDNLLVKYLALTEGLILNLEDAIEDKDYDKISFASHTLKGVAANLRLIPIYEITDEIEKASQSSYDIDYPVKLSHLKKIIDITAIKINKYLLSDILS